MRSIVSYALLLACLSGPSFASDAKKPSMDDNYSIQGDRHSAVKKNTINYLSSQLEILEQENEQLSITINNLRKEGDKTLSVDPNIHGLIEENKRLSLLLKQNSIKNLQAKIVYMQSDIDRFEKENKEIKASLKKAVELSKKQNDIYVSRDNNVSRNDKITETQPVSILMVKLDKLQRENAGLRAKVETQEKLTWQKNIKKPPYIDQGVNKDIALLKDQNKSLSETIRAQSKLLLSADNASKTADNLLTENMILQRKLEQSKREKFYKGKSSKELFERNAVLKNEILKRDKYIDKMLMVKSMVDRSNEIEKQGTSPKLAHPQKPQGLQAGRNINAMFDKNRSLENDLRLERESTVSYRSKIREYQEEIARLNSMTSDD